MTGGPPSCRVFWGSHGCSLARGHAGDGHQCGLAGDVEDGGLCSRIDFDPGEGIWVQRFSTVEETWDDERYPALAFGEDLPPDLLVDTEAVDAVRARWQAEGRLAFWDREVGRWVKRVGGK